MLKCDRMLTESWGNSTKNRKFSFVKMKNKVSDNFTRI